MIPNYDDSYLFDEDRYRSIFSYSNNENQDYDEDNEEE